MLLEADLFFVPPINANCCLRVTDTGVGELTAWGAAAPQALPPWVSLPGWHQLPSLLGCTYSQPGGNWDQQFPVRETLCSIRFRGGLQKIQKLLIVRLTGILDSPFHLFRKQPLELQISAFFFFTASFARHAKNELSFLIHHLFSCQV